METPNYGLGTLAVELTRKCNMKCGHCMRGTAQRKDMPDDVMDAIVEKTRGSSICTLLIGGGESSLAPERLMTLAKKMAEANTYPGIFYIVTNGKRMSEEFMRAVAYVYETCSETYLTISNDNMHERLSPSYVESMKAKISWMTTGRYGSLEVGTRYGEDEHRHTTESILKMGRGATECCGFRGDTVCAYDVLGEKRHGLDPLGEDMFYVDVDGNVWPSCDLSYRFMRMRRDMSLGNVKDPVFEWYDAAVRFNLRHAGSLPKVVVEPGFEDSHITTAPRDYEVESSGKRVAASAIIARRMKLTINR